MADTLHQQIQEFVLENRRAPTTDEIYDMANFREPGGINRLLEALVVVGRGFYVANRGSWR